MCKVQSSRQVKKYGSNQGIVGAGEEVGDVRDILHSLLRQIAQLSARGRWKVIN